MRFFRSLPATLSGAIALALTACATPAEDSGADPKVAHGQALAHQFCASCHAIGRGDASRMEGAIPFRDLSQPYPVSDLAESLVEGLVTGHPDMPEFRFSTEAANDLISFLESIQAR